MDINLREMTVTLSLAEMNEIINGREKAAYTDLTMSDGKSQNYLICCMNDGVRIMAKYMRDYFNNAFDNAKYGEEK